MKIKKFIVDANVILTEDLHLYHVMCMGGRSFLKPCIPLCENDKVIVYAFKKIDPGYLYCLLWKKGTKRVSCQMTDSVIEPENVYCLDDGVIFLDVDEKGFYKNWDVYDFARSAAYFDGKKFEKCFPLDYAEIADFAALQGNILHVIEEDIVFYLQWNGKRFQKMFLSEEEIARLVPVGALPLSEADVTEAELQEAKFGQKQK